MKTLIKLIQANVWFIAPYMAFLLLLGPVIWYFPKIDIHLYLNNFHCVTADCFFKSITHLGDGSAPFILAGLILFVSFRKSMQIALTGAIAGITAQILKRTVFSDVLRPYAIFKDVADFHLVQGVEMHSSFSFPSGHTTTIFSLCLCFAFFTKSNPLKIVLLLTALIVAYSRVYLSQHYLIDIYFGSILGVLITIPFYWLIGKSEAQYLNTSVIKLLKRTENE